MKDLGYRKAFIASQINIGIPFQIRALMKARGWTQDTLAEKTGMLQPRISGLMKPGKTRPNIETLRRVAEAFDCALIVRFAPFSELARWSMEFEPDSFNVPSFDDDTGFIERKAPQATTASKSIMATGTNAGKVLTFRTQGNQTAAIAEPAYAEPQLRASTIEQITTHSGRLT
jgi:transcriptional regulator with XRE-family HTH domain